MGGIQKPKNGSAETNTNQSRGGLRPGPGLDGPARPGNKLLVLDSEDAEGLQEGWGSGILQTCHSGGYHLNICHSFRPTGQVCQVGFSPGGWEGGWRAGAETSRQLLLHTVCFALAGTVSWWAVATGKQDLGES